MTSFRLPDETHVSQVHLRVRDLRRTLDFYEQVIGLRRIAASAADAPTAAVSATGHAPALLVFTQARDAAPRPARATGLYHTAIRYPARRDLAVALQRLVLAGYPIDGASDHGISEAIYLTDPEGNGVELCVDRPREQWPLRDGRLDFGPPAPLDLRALLATAADSDASSDGRLAPADTTIGHIHLHVGELAAAERFFHGFLGLDVMARVPGAEFFAAGGYHHHIGANTWAGRAAPPPESVGLVSYRLQVLEPEVLYCLRHRAPLSGYETVTTQAENGAELLRLRDPNGHWLELLAA